MYYLVLIKDNNIYLMFVHPKTGSLGSENITDEAKKDLYKKVLEAIKTQNLYKVSTNLKNENLIFEKKENSKIATAQKAKK